MKPIHRFGGPMGNASKVSRGFGPLVLLSLLLHVAACGSEVDTPMATQVAPASGPGQPASADEAAPLLLAQLTFSAGGSISFSEPSPGVVVVEEQGSLTDARLPTEGEDELDAAELYERLSGRTAPAALVRAVARARGEAVASEQAVVDAEAPVQAVPIQVAQVKGRGDIILHEDFLARFCTRTDRFVSFIDASGDHLFQTPNSNMNYFKSGAYSRQGTFTYRFNAWDAGISLRLQGTKAPKEPQIIERGWYVWDRVDCNDCRAEAKVTAPSDTRYDLCINWHY